MISPRRVFFILVCCVAGCSKGGETLPDMHPAKGSLTKNGRPVKGGFVQFTPVDNRDYTVTGDVNSLGKFELVTINRDKKMKGAPPGEYSIVYRPPGDKQAVQSIAPTKKYVIEAKDNDLKIELMEE